jgi:hypothetical protein
MIRHGWRLRLRLRLSLCRKLSIMHFTAIPHAFHFTTIKKIKKQKKKELASGENKKNRAKTAKKKDVPFRSVPFFFCFVFSNEPLF